jgi:uncharacterized repeat protein (TIGR02543 family)
MYIIERNLMKIQRYSINPSLLKKGSTFLLTLIGFMSVFAIQNTVNVQASEPNLFVTSGLVLHLDASNSNSYSGDGDTWTNLVNNSGFEIVNFDGFDSENQAIKFKSSSSAGQGTFVNLGNLLPNNSSYTKEAFVLASSLAGSHNIISTSSSPFWVTSSVLYGGLSGSYFLVSSGSFPLNSFVHVAVTFDDPSNTMTLYVNGVQVSQNKNVTQTYTSQALRIGAHGNAVHNVNSDAYSFWDGQIGLVRIYNRALIREEVNYNYIQTRASNISYSIDVITDNVLFRASTETLVSPDLVLSSANHIPVVNVLLNGALSGDILSGPLGCNPNPSNTILTCVNPEDSPSNNASLQALLRQITFQTDNSSESLRSITFGIGDKLPFEVNGHFYDFIVGSYTWEQARIDAMSPAREYFGIQGYLATITSADENAFIVSKLKETGWIGFSDALTEGQWRWVTGPEAIAINQTPYPFTYTNWNQGEPNNSNNEDYAQIFFNSSILGLWNDLNGTQTLGYVIEYGWDNGDTDNLISSVTLTYNPEVVYTITYNSDGGTLDSPITTYVASMGTVTLPIPSKIGFEFVGWFESNEFTGDPVVTFNTSDAIDKTFYANWEINTTSIIFEVNGGSVIETISGQEGTTVTSPENPTRMGYFFDGWFTSVDFTIPYSFSTFPQTDITVYAKWISIVESGQPVVINNDKLRFGNGIEASINSYGGLKQPFYYSEGFGWRKLTFSNYPLDYRIGFDGDGTNLFNINGTILENRVLSNLMYDFNGFTPRSQGGYGTIIVSGVWISGSTQLIITNTYTLELDASFIKITTRIENPNETIVSNLRYWTGTRDDFVGGNDGPTKTKGNLSNNGFEAITEPSQIANALEIKTMQEGVLFFTVPSLSNDKLMYSNSSINRCCSFSNATNQNPVDSVITVTGDGSYAIYFRFSELSQSEYAEVVWYYAAGELNDLTSIAEQLVAASTGAVSDITYQTANFTTSSSVVGSGYYLVTLSSSPNMTSSEIKSLVLGQTSNNDLLIVDSGIVQISQIDTDVISTLFNLQPTTSYKLHFVQEYIDNGVLTFATPLYNNFTTPNYDDPTFGTTAEKNITGRTAEIELSFLNNGTSDNLLPSQIGFVYVAMTNEDDAILPTLGSDGHVSLAFDTSSMGTYESLITDLDISTLYD